MKDRLPLVLSLVALAASLLALTQRGTAAQMLLPPHSVGTAQLKNGAVTAAKVRAHSLLKRNFKRGPAPVAVQETQATLAELEIPQAGGYVISAKAYFESTGSGIATITCTLDTLEGDADAVQLLAGSPSPAALSVAHVYAGPGVVDLSCAARAAADAHYVRITAIRVGTLTATSLGQAKR